MDDVQAVILDMDGVLVDSEPLQARAWQEALAGLGLERQLGWFDSWIGIADSIMAEHLAERPELDRSPAELLELKRSRYKEIVAREMRLYPDLADRLQRLRAGLAERGPAPLLAVVTSSSRGEMQQTLLAVGLQDFFPVQVSADDVARLKPAPDPFLRAIELLGVAPAQCLVVEDSPTGVAAGLAAGCTVLAVLTTHTRDQLAAATHVVPDTAAALDWSLERLAAGRDAS